MEQKRLASLISWNSEGAIPSPATPVTRGRDARFISATARVRSPPLGPEATWREHAPYKRERRVRFPGLRPDACLSRRSRHTPYERAARGFNSCASD